MSSRPPPPSSPLSNLSTLLSTWAQNFQTNTRDAFQRMTPKDYLRLVVIVCAYMLLRPYIIKLGARVQAQQLEKAQREEAVEAAMNGNDLRGLNSVPIPGVDSESEEENPEDKQREQWGRKARLRQRRMIREAIIAREEDGESDEEIKEFLED